MEDIGVGVNVAGRIVGVELIGVRLGAVIAVIISVGTVVAGMLPAGFTHAPTRNMVRITEDTIAIRFDAFIHKSISASKHCDN